MCMGTRAATNPNPKLGTAWPAAPQTLQNILKKEAEWQLQELAGQASTACMDDAATKRNPAHKHESCHFNDPRSPHLQMPTHVGA